MGEGTTNPKPRRLNGSGYLITTDSMVMGEYKHEISARKGKQQETKSPGAFGAIFLHN